jgi:hypothetical protein
LYATRAPNHPNLIRDSWEAVCAGGQQPELFELEALIYQFIADRNPASPLSLLCQLA